MVKTYTIIIKHSEYVKITEEGAKIIWAAYTKLYGTQSQTMDRREERGGVCHLSEIDYWKGQGALDKDFNWKDYEVKEEEAE